MSCLTRSVLSTPGSCIGGGIDLITACDIRICSSDATFCVKVGKSLSAGGVAAHNLHAVSAVSQVSQTLSLLCVSYHIQHPVTVEETGFPSAHTGSTPSNVCEQQCRGSFSAAHRVTQSGSCLSRATPWNVQQSLAEGWGLTRSCCAPSSNKGKLAAGL